MDPITPNKGRLCELYLRDVITFLPPRGINAEFRAVSRHLDSSASNCPESKLPRRLFDNMRLYAVGDPRAPNMDGSWKIPFQLKECCHELKVGSAIQRMYRLP